MTEQKAEGLEQSILATLLYYDILGMPLTLFEVWKYLIDIGAVGRRNIKAIEKNISLFDLLACFRGSDYLKQKVSSKWGYFFLVGREGILAERIRKQKIAEEKFKKVKLVLKLFRAVPFVRAVFMVGSVAIGHPNERSDIDVLVVTRRGRIWTARSLLTALVKSFGLYRTVQDPKDKICLNHYLVEGNLLLKESLYNAHSYTHLVVLFDKSEVFEHFFKANKWIGKFLPNVKGVLEDDDSRTFRKSHLCNFVAKVGEFLLSGIPGSFLERVLKFFEQRRIRKDPRTKMGRVRATDAELEFHPLLKEKEIAGKFWEAFDRLRF